MDDLLNDDYYDGRYSFYLAVVPIKATASMGDQCHRRNYRRNINVWIMRSFSPKIIPRDVLGRLLYDDSIRPDRPSHSKFHILIRKYSNHFFVLLLSTAAGVGIVHGFIFICQSNSLLCPKRMTSTTDKICIWILWERNGNSKNF